MGKFRDETGQTILHIAVDAMNNSAVGAIGDLDYTGKMLNIQDGFGMSPMHIAAINFDMGIFGHLIQMNPDKDLKDSTGKNFIEYLKDNEDIDQGILKALDI